MAMIPSSSTNNARLQEKLECLRGMMQKLKRKEHDIQNEVRNEEIQARKKRKSEVALWLDQVSSIEDHVQSIGTEVAQVGFFGRGQLSNKLEEMMDDVEQLLKQSEFPRGLMLDDVKHEGLELVAQKMEGSTPSRVEDQVWSCFERGKSRVGVFGIGGVGKTSLAMNINNLILKQQRLFKCVYYVTVSRETSILKLQSDIAKAFGFGLNYEDEPKRAAELKEALAKRENCLLILDDVWEDIEMEEIGVSVEGDGCKLLITTRDRGVCHRMNCFPVPMETLSPGESWDLFKKKLENFETLPDEIKEIATLVAEECDGLPLGIVTMARSMRGVTSVHVWRDALNSLRNPSRSLREMKNRVFRILQHSYDRLYNDKHRKCFLFCALYREDYHIVRDKLIRQLIGAGLLEGTNRKESIEEGHTLLDHLENASLLESVREWGGRYVKMHDLVRDMAIGILGSTAMLKGRMFLKEIPGKKEWSDKDLEWVSLMDNRIELIQDILLDCPKISVLWLQFNPLRRVSDSFFVKMSGLKVLNLSFTSVKKLPGSISGLVNLNALLLSNCAVLEYIPSLANLTKLRELDMSWCWKMRTLPEGMEKLSSLEHVNLHNSGIEGVYEGIFINLLNLERFLFDGKMNVPPKGLISLKHLKMLYGAHIIFEDFSGFRQCVGHFNSLETYDVTVQPKGFLDYPRYSEKRVDTDKKLAVKGAEECFLVPRNLGALKLTKCSFSVGSLLEALPSLADVTDLQHCELNECPGIEYIMPKGWTKKPIQCIGHIKLLELRNLDEFRGLIREEVVHPFISFWCLRKLEIKYCRRLKKLWMLNLDLSNLEVIHIEDCEQMEQIFATEQGVTIRLPKLHCLELKCLPELRSIWGNCKVFFPNLFSLKVLESPTMKNIGMVSHNLPSLEKVEIRNCIEMEEIFTAEDEVGDDEIHLPKLVVLVLSNVPELRSISRKTIVCNSLQYASLLRRTLFPFS